MPLTFNADALDIILRLMQAGSSVIALVIAIYVPIRIHASNKRIAEDERQLKANALAFFIAPDVFEIANEAIRAHTLLELCPTLKKQQYSRQEVIKTLAIKSAQRLQTITDNLWLLGRECSSSVNKAITYSLYINRKIEDKFVADDILVKDIIEFSSIYSDDYKLIQTTVDQALSLLEKHYDLTLDGRRGPSLKVEL